jgi:hypothetical protein
MKVGLLGLRRAIVGALAGLAALVAAGDAHAGSNDYEPRFYGAVTIVASDVWFLGYDIQRVEEGIVHRGAITAQTVVWTPQAAAFNFGFAWGQVDDENSAALTLGFMVPSIWANAMATFGAWTLASEQLPIADRFAVSWLLGSNVTFTTGAITSLFRPTSIATPYLSTPEAVVQATQTVGCIVWAAGDEAHRVEWLALGGWSALLATHGFVSIISWDDRPSGGAESARSDVARVTPRVTGVGPFGAGPGVSLTGVF